MLYNVQVEALVTVETQIEADSPQAAEDLARESFVDDTKEAFAFSNNVTIDEQSVVAEETEEEIEPADKEH